MPQQGPSKSDDSLFSLELVVEKVYIPYTPCRFPAIAFRLLDYPTIVIKHVEDDLGKAIRSKISFDPYFQLPDQFIELKDKHGNFMVNKGKSCLLRIPADTLKQHLANTPLYVMIIDLFPEVPKLVGNSSVPLTTLMDSICTDIAKLGPTVPSVHGDKGLFKLYNLMGKEIGYFVLGFRLLCLGPSLIPHLPDSVLLQQRSKGKEARENKSLDVMIQNQQEETGDSDEPEVQLKNSACMTDPIKHDVLLQTVEMQDKAIHVVVSATDRQTETNAVSEKGSCTTSTQTERRKNIKEAHNAQQKWAEFVGCHTDDADDIIINNIVCPPPLFYNSNASPSIKINREHKHDEIVDDDLSDIESYDGQGLENIKPHSEGNTQQEFAPSHQAIYFQPEKEFRYPALPIPQARAGEIVQGLQVAPNPGTVFPLLTALIHELSCIQSPQLLLNVSNQMQAASLKLQKPDNSPEKNQIQKTDKLSPSVVSAIATALTKRHEISTETRIIDRTERLSLPLNSHLSTVPEITSQERQQCQKQTSVRVPKKTKLVYKLTNTQRLRLQKTNPQWLKATEKEVADLKMKTLPTKKQTEVDDINSTVFSDTLTEVRRLAERELSNTACTDTLLDIPSEVEVSPESVAQHKDESKVTLMKAEDVAKKSNQVQKVKRPSRFRPLQKTPSPRPKGRLRLQRSQTSQQSEKVKDTSDSDEHVRRRPVLQVRHQRGLTSPLHDGQEPNTKDKGGQLSPDLLSSRSRSIEVCLPSPDLDDSDGSIPLPDDSLKEKGEPQSVNFQKYLSRDISPPESINGEVNASLNISDVLDEHSPLESTRHSKNLTSDQNDSKVLQSTDYDTHQFQSTDEPELQDLVSEEEGPSGDVNSGRRPITSLRGSQKFPVINPQLSENSPVPSVRKSTNKLDPTAHGYIPSFSQRLDSSDSSRSTTPKSRVSATKGFKTQPLIPEENGSGPVGQKGIDLTTSKTSITPRSTSSSPRRPTPQPRKPFRGSLHTDSLSSYMPSDPDNVIVSLSSNSGNYSDDFLLHEFGQSKEITSSVEQPHRLIPSSKLGYTIH